MTKGELDFAHGASVIAARYHSEICQLYDSVFSAPPFVWNENGSAMHSRELVELRRIPTFGITIAMNGESLIGFAYGHTLPIDHGWWSGFPGRLSADLVREWEGRTFALIDLAVDKSWRGRGVGRRLLHLLFSSRAEERAVLSVQPTAVETQNIYLHWGWRRVGRKGPISGVTPPYWDIFMRTLT